MRLTQVEFEIAYDLGFYLFTSLALKGIQNYWIVKKSVFGGVGLFKNQVITEPVFFTVHCTCYYVQVSKKTKKKLSVCLYRVS